MDAVPTAPPPALPTLTAVAQAHAAQADWAALPIRRRLAILARLRQSLPQNLDDLLPTLRHPQRRDDGESITSEILPLIDAIAFLQREAARILRPRHCGRHAAPRWIGHPRLELQRQPCGVVLIIGPANYPLFLPGVQALQALAAGNTVLVKPGSGGVAAAQLLGRLLQAAGLPEDCYTVLDPDPDSASTAIAAGVDLVLLTGSRAVGLRVQQACAEAGVPCILELAGADAVFVLPEADLNAASEAIVFALGLNSGATCIGPRRCFVPQILLPELARQLRRRLIDHPPLQPPTAALAAAQQVMDTVVADGGELIVGSFHGDRMTPTVLRAPALGLRHFHHELFAPILALVGVRDLDEALSLDAGCPYALGASVFGPSAAALRLARRCRAGCVTINDLVVPSADPRLPFGGRQASGFGVTRGAEGLLALTRVQAISRVPARQRRRRLTPAAGRELVTLLHGRGVSRLHALYRLARGQQRSEESS